MIKKPFQKVFGSDLGSEPFGVHAACGSSFRNAVYMKFT